MVEITITGRRTVARLAMLKAAWEADSDGEVVRRALELAEDNLTLEAFHVETLEDLKRQAHPSRVVPDDLTLAEPWASFQSGARASVPVQPISTIEPPAPDPSEEDALIPPTERRLQQERALVASFIRIDGREWKGSGPTPLEPGCSISPFVLREFEGGLAKVRILNERAREEERIFGGR